MALTKRTQGDLQRELKNLRRERAGLDKTITAFEAILARNTVHPGSPSDTAVMIPREINTRRNVRARRGRGPRKRVKGTHIVAELLKRAGKPLAPRDIAAIATEDGKRISYDAIYAALRKSPLFTKSGTKWWLRDRPDGHSVPVPVPTVGAAPDSVVSS